MFENEVIDCFVLFSSGLVAIDGELALHLAGIPLATATPSIANRGRLVVRDVRKSGQTIRDSSDADSAGLRRGSIDASGV